MDTQTQFRGLSNELVSKSRLENGSNILTPPKKTPVWRLFLEKLKDPIIRILLIALILSFLVACYQYFTGIESGNVFLEPAGILLAVLLATGVGFLFERSANKKFDILNQINDETAVRVIRNARVVEVGRQDIVVGDIILLETGDEVPADATLLDAVSLQINESSLTGEPSIGKTTNPSQFDKDSTYPSNEVLRGTTVIDGHAVAEVIRVGDATEYGKVYTGSQIENQVETPLNKQLKRLSKLITYASYLVATLIIVGRLIMYFSLHEAPLDWLQLGGFLLNTLMIAVTVIVVTVPEGLPMSVTLSLALSMKRMLSANNLVRKMHACETMGACTVICTDKTGTLTQNQMTVYETVFYALGDIPEKKLELKADDLSRIIKENIAVNTTAFLEKTDPMHLKVLGNPTEGALLLWLNAQGEHYEIIRSSAKMVEQLTFSTERKYMATVVDSFLHPGKRLLFVKGAPEIVLSLCKEIIVDGKEVPAEEYSAHIDQQLADYQAKAMRTLGFAYAEIDKDQEISCFENGQLRKNLPLKYLGIVAISDPVRSDVPEAIQSCLDAGIDIKIVTGDTPGTATEIARQIKLWKEEYTEENRITGPEFGLLSEEELEERVLKLKIISRARPMDKERLVKALQRKGQVV
ncbi:MAG: HAD-IC family P-type ATPase, partial [Bacteroidales bacterium]